MQMNAQYFINKFKAISEERWGTLALKDDEGRCCALGHCGVKSHSYADPNLFGLVITEDIPTDESTALVSNFKKSKFFQGSKVTDINDGLSWFTFLGETPRERLLNALEIIRNEQELEAVETAADGLAALFFG